MTARDDPGSPPAPPEPLLRAWTGRNLDEPRIELRLDDACEIGSDAGRGNLVGIQPFMATWDYASEARFYAKLAGYMEAARERRWLNERTIAVFPEYVGTWLVAAGEKRAVYQSRTITQALRTLVLAHLFPFLRLLPSAQAEDRAKDSLFRLKAARMAEIYHAVFSRLAGEYAVTVVAGSTVLPSPSVHQGALAIGDGALYNVSAVYRPDGSSHERLVRKAFPTLDEADFVTGSSVAELPTFDTPAGRLAVLICADSWHPEAYRALLAHRPDLVVVPSCLVGDGSWQRPWRGYTSVGPQSSGEEAPMPDDVDPKDVGRLTEGQAWLKYSLPGRLRGSGASRGLTTFLRGDLWDLGSDGHTIVVNGPAVIEAKHVSGAALVNCWLGQLNPPREDESRRES